MPTITEDELLQKAEELGTVGDAVKWMKSQGLTLAANPVSAPERELPPLREQQGGLSAVTEVADTGEEEEAVDAAEDAGMTGALDLANLDFGQLKSDPGAFFKSILAANQAAEERAAQSAKQLYEQGRQRIMEKYAGPSQSERLFALSRAMLSPTDRPGFAGFLGNVTGALEENAKARRVAEQTREEQLFALQQQYQQGEAARAAGRPKTAADLAAKYLAATKAPAKSTASPIIVGADARPRIRATGAEFREPPQDQIYALQQYMRDPTNTPENKMITRRNFDKKFGYGAAAIYVGEE